MTPLHWVLSIFAAGLVVALAILLVYTVYAMLKRKPTISAYMQNAPRWVVAAVAFTTGLIVGILFSHWWFPTMGNQ